MGDYADDMELALRLDGVITDDGGEKMMVEKTSWFTFGFQHAHAVGGFTYDKDVVVKITAEDPRAVMVETFGQQWAFEYDHEPDLSYYPRGVRELRG